MVRHHTFFVLTDESYFIVHFRRRKDEAHHDSNGSDLSTGIRQHVMAAN